MMRFIGLSFLLTANFAVATNSADNPKPTIWWWQKSAPPASKSSAQDIECLVNGANGKWKDQQWVNELLNRKDFNFELIYETKWARLRSVFTDFLDHASVDTMRLVLDHENFDETLINSCRTSQLTIGNSDFTRFNSYVRYCELKNVRITALMYLVIIRFSTRYEDPGRVDILKFWLHDKRVDILAPASNGYTVFDIVTMVPHLPHVYRKDERRFEVWEDVLLRALKRRVMNDFSAFVQWCLGATFGYRQSGAQTISKFKTNNTTHKRKKRKNQHKNSTFWLPREVRRKVWEFVKMPIMPVILRMNRSKCLCKGNFDKVHSHLEELKLSIIQDLGGVVDRTYYRKKKMKKPKNRVVKKKQRIIQVPKIN